MVEREVAVEAHSLSGLLGGTWSQKCLPASAWQEVCLHAQALNVPVTRSAFKNLGFCLAMEVQ